MLTVGRSYPQSSTSHHPASLGGPSPSPGFGSLLVNRMLGKRSASGRRRGPCGQDGAAVGDVVNRPPTWSNHPANRRSRLSTCPTEGHLVHQARAARRLDRGDPSGGCPIRLLGLVFCRRQGGLSHQKQRGNLNVKSRPLQRYKAASAAIVFDNPNSTSLRRNIIPISERRSLKRKPQRTTNPWGFLDHRINNPERNPATLPAF